MRTIQLHIRSSLPKNLEPLCNLARNIWWSWNIKTINLFRQINTQEYEASGFLEHEIPIKGITNGVHKRN
jgi:hypothetical protein